MSFIIDDFILFLVLTYSFLEITICIQVLIISKTNDLGCGGGGGGGVFVCVALRPITVNVGFWFYWSGPEPPYGHSYSYSVFCGKKQRTPVLKIYHGLGIKTMSPRAHNFSTRLNANKFCLYFILPKSSFLPIIIFLYR